MQELNKAIDDIRSKGELSNGITTRYAVPEDAKRLLEIYAPYVENTAITFNMMYQHWKNLLKESDIHLKSIHIL